MKTSVPSAIERELIKAIRAHRLVTLLRRGDPPGLRRIVEPHILYQERSGREYVNVYQVDGYSESGDIPAWRNLPVGDIRLLLVLDATFEPRWAEGYNPKSNRRYHRIVQAA